MPWFRTLRIAALLSVLVVVALGTWQERLRSTRWREPLFVAIYPIAADASPVTGAYLASLQAQNFHSIDLFFSREAARYPLRTSEPVRVRLRSALASEPPRRAEQAGMLGTAWWSLKLRYWAWSVSRRGSDPEDIRIFVLYHDPTLSPSVPHSLGLTKGLIGVVYAFADPRMSEANDVVIAHELLHTVGATDKYDPANDAPRFPDGYGDPTRQPLYPQPVAEIMAGRRMLAADRWMQTDGLDEEVIGPATAREIRWTR